MNELTTNKISLEALTPDQMSTLLKMVAVDDLKEEYKKREKTMNFDMGGIKNVWLSNKATQTTKMYSHYLEQFLAFIAEKGITIQEVTALVADEFIVSLKGSTSGINLATSAISSFYSTLLRYDEVEKNPFSGTNKMPKKRRTKELHIPTEGDITIAETFLLNKIYTSQKSSLASAKKLYVALHLMKTYGFRIGALSTIKIQGTTYTAYSKGKEISGKFYGSSLLLIEKLGVALEDLNSNTLQNNFKALFTALYNAGRLEHILHPHSLRHHYAVTEYLADHDIYKLSKRLHHSSVSITQNYLSSLNVT